MRIEWTEADGRLGPLGHGVEFHAGRPRGQDTLLAFLPGYDWLQDSPEVVKVQVRGPDDDCPTEMLQSLRTAVEIALREGGLRQGYMPGERFFAWFNA